MRDKIKDDDYYCTWITVNRKCNLSSQWCYARDYVITNNSVDMSLELMYNLIDLCSSCSVKKIIFIGGEPTLYPYLIDGIKHCKELSITAEIVTNGIALSNKSFVERLYHAGLSSVVLSIKGSNREDFYDTTGSDTFPLIQESIENLNSVGLKCVISAVLTSSFISHIEDVFKMLIQNNIKKIVFSFLKEFGSDNDNQTYYSSNLPNVILEQLYYKMNQSNLTFNNIDWTIESCFPILGLSDEVEEFFANRFHYSCMHLKNAPLVFDSLGNLLACNAYPNLTYGKYGIDFVTHEELLNYLKTRY